MAKYKRSILVINPRFQYKFCFVVCTLVLLMSLVYPFTIYDIFGSFATQFPQFKDRITAQQQELFIVLLLSQALFLAAIFVLCLFISHKIAGPMFKIVRYLREVASGSDIYRISFRDGDNFPELAAAVNEAMDYFKEQRKEDFEYLEEVEEYIDNLSYSLPDDKKPVVQEVIKSLRAIREKYQQGEEVGEQDAQP